MASPQTSFNAGQNLTYARSITASTVTAVQPVGFAGGGAIAKVYNSGAVAVMVVFYNHAAGDPTLVFPVDGAPPVGKNGGQQSTSVVVAPGQTIFLDAVASYDSFAAIGAAAGPSIVYVQKGEGGSGC